MYPKLILENIQDLHDARYCAAVGISVLSFNLNPATPSLSATQVGEIMEWLSGPQGIAVFDSVPPTEINSQCAAAKCAFASVPLEYPIDWVADIELPVIFRLSGSINEHGTLLQKMNRFPMAIVEMDAELMKTSGQAQTLRTLASRAILRCASAEILHEMAADAEIQPWGFVLGEFVLDSNGGIDYECCDAFLEAIAI